MKQKDKELSLKERLLKLLSMKRSKVYYCKKLGISKDLLEQLLQEIRDEKKSSEISEAGSDFFVNSKYVNLETGDIKSSVSLEKKELPPDLKTENLAKIHNIDLSRYKITHYWSKETLSGKIISSVHASSLKNEISEKDFENIIERVLKRNLGKVRSVPIPKSRLRKSIDVEVSMYDFHLGKKTINNESVEFKKQIFLEFSESLMEDASRYADIDTILFPISNDFFNSDTFHNTTTNGTIQSCNLSYAEEFEHGFDLMLSVIQMMLKYGKRVKVILVPGNHDRTKGYYLAHALSVFFSKEKRVEFLREDTLTKFVKIGNTFIGYYHGYKGKLEELPIIFATDPICSSYFGESLYKEIHVGHLHHYTVKEVKGVRIQRMPSLSGNDVWSVENLHVNQIRSGLVILYDKEEGRIGEFEKRLKNEHFKTLYIHDKSCQ